MVKDPVCGMEIEPQSAAATREHMGQTFYFCSAQCAATFDANPHQYAHQEMGSNSMKPLAGSATTGFNPDLPGSLQVELPIAGLTCSTCVTTVERGLQAVPGVAKVHVNFVQSKAHISFNPEQADVSDFIGAIKKAGYNVGTAEMRVRITPGLYCASCVGFIEEALNDVPGVLAASVSPGTDTALISYVPEQVDFAAVQAAVESTGYQVARPVEQEESVDEETAAHQREYQTLMRKFWFATAVAIPVMLVAYPEVSWLYLPNLFVDEASETLIRLLFILSAVVTLPVMAYSKRHFFTST